MAKGDLPSAKSKSLLTTDQFKSGVETDSLQKQVMTLGEVVTDTRMVLEKGEVSEGELWGDRGHDKLNEQVKSAIS